MNAQGLEMMNHAALVAATTAAAEHGLLQALVEGEASAEGFAQALGLDARATERVLDVLASNGMVEHEGAVYRAGPSLRAMNEFMPLGAQYAVWRHAPEFLRSGEPGLLGRQKRGRIYSQVTPALGRMAELPAQALRDALSEEKACKAIVDVGAGAGVWSLTMAERDDNTRVTAVDLPDVVGVFENEAERRGMMARVDVLAGDYHDAPVPEARYDRLVLANVLRLETEDAAAQLLTRWSRALRPGGLLVVVDAISDGSPAGEKSRAAYALHLAMRNAVGFPHREPTIRRWMERAGLSPDRRIDLGGGMALAALLGRVA